MVKVPDHMPVIFSTLPKFFTPLQELYSRGASIMLSCKGLCKCVCVCTFMSVTVFRLFIVEELKTSESYKRLKVQSD